MDGIYTMKSIGEVLFFILLILSVLFKDHFAKRMPVNCQRSGA